MSATPHLAYSLPSLLTLAGLACAVALVPLAWWWRAQRGATPAGRLAALTTLTLWLTFDLIVFGAFTRLTDSGLGCPDWPGCYGQAHPVAADAHIQAAQALLPDGPVTVAKAWIEMLHRYLAMAVGALILLAAVLAWRSRRSLPHSPAWAGATLVWVVVQGLFGRWTVTWKLYPAIVTAHLLGALLLLVLLVVQHESFRDRRLALPGVSRAAVLGVLAVVVLQVLLGGWVSTNYAVLACRDFPTCGGQWWPTMDPANGFTLARELGRTAEGGFLPFEALVAIHWAHRLFAVVALVAVGVLAWRLRGGAGQWHARALALLLVAQAASGLSNVVLGWPIAAALAHSAGAAALVGLLASLAARLQPARQAAARPVAGPLAEPLAPRPPAGPAPSRDPAFR